MRERAVIADWDDGGRLIGRGGCSNEDERKGYGNTTHDGGPEWKSMRPSSRSWGFAAVGIGCWVGN